MLVTSIVPLFRERVERTESRKYLPCLYAFFFSWRQFLELGQVGSLRVKLVTRRQVYMYICIHDNCTLLLLLCDEKETDAVGETEVRLNHCFWAAVNFRFRYTMTSAHCALYLQPILRHLRLLLMSLLDKGSKRSLMRCSIGSMSLGSSLLATSNCSIFPFVHKYM